MQNPIQAIVQHSEHGVLYAQDPLMQGFHARQISHMLDIVCENQGQTGFTVAEIGAGTGGFTRQVIAELDRSPFSELRSYTATDITPAFGPNLLQLVNNSKLDFKASKHSKPTGCQTFISWSALSLIERTKDCNSHAVQFRYVHGQNTSGETKYDC
jgi:fatty acid synthase